SGLFQVVLAGYVADGEYVTDVFDGGGYGDGDHEQDGAPAEGGCYEVRYSEPGGLLDGGGVNNAGECRQDVTHDDAEHDRDQPEDAFCPDRHHNGDDQGGHGNPDGGIVGHQLGAAVTGAAGGHVDGQGGKAEADGHDHRGDHHRWQQAGDEARAAQAYGAGKHDVEDACCHQAAHGFLQAELAFGGHDRSDEGEG